MNSGKSSPDDSNGRSNADAADSSRARLPDQAQCLGCGYLLRDLRDCRCPECGTGFSPDGPATFFDPLRESARQAAWRRMWSDESRRIPSLRYLCAACAFCLSVMLLASTPAGVWLMDRWRDSPTGIRLIPAILAVVTVGELGRLTVRFRIRTRDDAIENATPRVAGVIRITTLWFLIALSWTAYLYPWPLAIRFRGYADELGAAASLDVRGGPALRWREFGPVLVRLVRRDAPPSYWVATDDWIHRLVNRTEYGRYDLAIGLRYDPERGPSRGRRWLFGPWYVE